MEKADWFILTEMYMREIGKMINKKEKALTTIQTGQLIQESGSMICSMVTVFKNLQVAFYMKGTFFNKF